jgi:hypothetical protein
MPVGVAFLVGWIIQAVLWLFKNRIGFMILQILLWLGLTVATSTVIVAPVIAEIKSYANLSGGGVWGVVALQWLGVLRFDRALTMLFGAYTTRMAAGAGKAFLRKR